MSDDAVLVDTAQFASESLEASMKLEDTVAVPAEPLTEEQEALRVEELRQATIAAIDFNAIEPNLPAEWKRIALPAWLEKTGERLWVNSATSARLYRYVTAWEDGTWQEMWSVYVHSNKSPDSVCVRLDLALSMHERHRSSGFISKGKLLPWRT